MFYKELLYLIITISYLQDETSALTSSPSDPRLTIINVYSGLETINGEKVSNPAPEEKKDNNKDHHKPVKPGKPDNDDLDFDNEDGEWKKRLHPRRADTPTSDRDPIFVVDSNHRLRRLGRMSKLRNGLPSRRQMYPQTKNKMRKRAKVMRYLKRRSKASRIRS